MLTEEEAQELKDAYGQEVDNDEDEIRNLDTFANNNYQQVPHPSENYYQTGLVLRNLTKREYVREALVPRVESEECGQIGLGAMLLARISWSPTNDDVGSTGMRYARGIYKGVWARH